MKQYTTYFIFFLSTIVTYFAYFSLALSINICDRLCVAFLFFFRFASGEDAGVTPGLKRRRDRARRQQSLLREQYKNNIVRPDWSSTDDQGVYYI